MLRGLLIREDINARLLCMQFGERRLTNVLHLVETLHAEDVHRATPEVLLAWLQARLAEDARDEAAELRLESERNLVQIVTIHRAKGLEYPIVFCPFLWDGSTGRSVSHPYHCEYHDNRDNLVMDFRSLPEEQEERIKSESSADRLAERLRMTYVALTRAIHRCYVVVGSYSQRNGVSGAESRRGALNWLAAGGGMSAAKWKENKTTPDEMDAAWQALADQGGPGIGYGALPAEPGVPLRPSRASPQSIEILAPPAHILPGWRLGSYSQLIHGAAGDASAVDHDLRVIPADALDLGVPEATGAEDIVRFPRGLTAGHCIHAIFESADFMRQDGWSGEIAKSLRAHPQTPRLGSTAAHLPGMLMNMLKDVLSTPLPGGFRLAEVPRKRRLVELKFSLPASSITHLALRRILGRHGYSMPALNFPELRGYLNGAIDLVIEAADRYWVLDWKSNFLGATAAHYEAAALEAAMDLHHYHLQYLLYTAALHRYLQRRLPVYSYDQHFGGVLYLFVRGVRPGWTGRDGHKAGVYSVRPAGKLIEDLSALMVRAREVA
jgi:exodeoxyribonuclease V beta subunit